MAHAAAHANASRARREERLRAGDGVKIWYAIYGKGKPVLFLHGGLGNSNYWGNQVAEIAKHYEVIVFDSRGHGRSTRDADPYGYDLMSSDVLAALDYLKIPKVALVGWSDGAIIGLDIAIHHPERLSKLYAFAANSDPTGVADISKSDVFNAYIARGEKEYEKLSATPTEYQAFVDQISHMWASQPNWTADDLKKITVPTWIVDADHDEAIKRREHRVHRRQCTERRPVAPARSQPLRLPAGPGGIYPEHRALPHRGALAIGRSAVSAHSRASGDERMGGFV
ncbi:MAG: alpha/beta hydrolase [Bauldia sp.]